MRNILDLFTKVETASHTVVIDVINDNKVVDQKQLYHKTYVASDLKSLYGKLEQDAFNTLVTFESEKSINLYPDGNHIFISDFITSDSIVVFQHHYQLELLLKTVRREKENKVQCIQTDIDTKNTILVVKADRSNFIHYSRDEPSIKTNSFIRSYATCRSIFYNSAPREIIQCNIIEEN